MIGHPDSSGQTEPGVPVCPLTETRCVKAQRVSLFLPMPKILLIEDEASIRAVLKDILLDQKELRLEVDEAKDGAEGLRLLETNNYDLAFCDIKMPQMDRMEVLGKAKEKGIACPFVMISAHGTTEMAVDALRMGAYDFLQKPPDLNRLLITLR